MHGGQESTIHTFHPTLLHNGMIVVGLPYAEQRQMGLDEIKGGSPDGASTIAGNAGERMPSEQELGMALVRLAGVHALEDASGADGLRGLGRAGTGLARLVGWYFGCRDAAAANRKWERRARDPE